MPKNAVATRKDIDEVLAVIKDFMDITSHDFQSVDTRFNSLEKEMKMQRADIHKLITRLDSIEKDIEINDDERAVIGMQLTRLHNWVEKAAARVGVEFIR
jgi:archaellum component FlaC